MPSKDRLQDSFGPPASGLPQVPPLEDCYPLSRRIAVLLLLLLLPLLFLLQQRSCRTPCNETQLSVCRAQDDFRKLLRRATQEGAAAGDLQAAIQQGAPAPPSEAPGSGLYHELLNLRLSREELESAFAAEHAEQAKEEEERRQREQELVGE